MIHIKFDNEIDITAVDSVLSNPKHIALSDELVGLKKEAGNICSMQFSGESIFYYKLYVYNATKDYCNGNKLFSNKNIDIFLSFIGSLFGFLRWAWTDKFAETISCARERLESFGKISLFFDKIYQLASEIKAEEASELIQQKEEKYENYENVEEFEEEWEEESEPEIEYGKDKLETKLHEESAQENEYKQTEAKDNEQLQIEKAEKEERDRKAAGE
jgi:hypothetical protein